MELRTERKLSQKALAEQIQLAGYEFSDLTVLRIEKGTRFVPDYEVVALAEFFHVSCEYLLGVIRFLPDNINCYATDN
jgi:transcriptional regulator with XRE-family HTH domain